LNLFFKHKVNVYPSPSRGKSSAHGSAELCWRLILVIIVTSLGTATVYLAHDSTRLITQPLHLLVWGVWTSVQVLAFWTAVAHALDGFLSIEPLNNYLPQERVKVSIHVPIHREPPQIVSATLRSLAQLKLVPFEVVVIDNNTPEEALWRPIQELSDQLGFRFFHLEKWPGYKAGALNFARTVTSSDAGFIAVVDADYVVQPDFLSRLISHFSDPAVAFVQAPQDYQLRQTSVYQNWTFSAYRHFFAVNMAAHSRLDSVIFVGTMGIIRKSALDECGDWDERCVTEDAEIGLRIAANGYSGVFISTSYGKGLMPLDYNSFRRQRYRWALGGAQIFKKYWSHVFWMPRDPECPGLKTIQRLGFGLFLLYWFEPWLTVATMFLFWLVAIAFCLWPEFIEAAVPASSAVLAISMLSARVVLFVGSSMRRSRCSFADACGASMVFGSVNWLVSCACAKALWSRSVAFERTPKDKRSRQTLLGKLRSMTTEIALSVFGLGATTAMLLTATTRITMLHCVGCFLGCGMFALPLLVLIIDHIQWPTNAANPECC
jgi:cellulose synthase/poly-beta-1,6-N-acetylglucosamine synthase-like glycosyltransferase